LGNSISLKVRPPVSDEGAVTYAEHLSRHGYTVKNQARAASMIPEAYRWIDEDVIAEQPNILIIQFGIVESCTRRHPRWLVNAVTKNAYFNRVIGRNFEFETIVAKARRIMLRGLYTLVDQVTLTAKLRWRWLSEEKFVKCLHAMVALTLKDTKARIFILGMYPCDERIQRHLPGSIENILRLNGLMRAMAKDFPVRVSFVDVCEIINDLPIDQVVPDGIHFSAVAHRVLGEYLIGLFDAQGSAG